MIYIKQWGLKRSGTNYLRYLIEQNFQDVRVLVDVLGWKHGYPIKYPINDWKAWFPEWKPDFMPLTREEWTDVQASEISHICQVKHPLAWIDSMARFMGGKAGMVAELTDHHLNLFANQWNTTVYSYETHKDGIVITYESLLDDLDHTMERIQNEYHLPRVVDGNGWSWTTNRFDRGNDTQLATDCKIDKQVDTRYFTEQSYLREFTEKQLDVLRGVLDPELLGGYHYDGWL